MASLTHVPIAPLPPERFKEILSPEQGEGLDRAIERGHSVLDGRVVWSINSTARGGGVAEMLISLIAYTRGAGIDARWLVIEGTDEFFRVTKRLHNFLHGSSGDGGRLGEAELAVYRQVCEANAHELDELVRPEDVVLLHDPQTAGLVRPLKEKGATVVWRCHIGVDLPNDLSKEGWRFLLPHVEPAHAYVFSREAFAWKDLPRSKVAIIPPSIDAFSPKNQALGEEALRSILRTTGLEDGAPPGSATFVRQDGTPGRVDRPSEVVGGPVPEQAALVAQVSRWDRLKDPSGVLEAFVDRIAPASDAHLVLAGPSVAAVADDPEGREVLADLKERWESLPEAVSSRVHLASLPMDDAGENAAIVNALQRRSQIVVQKSLAEGFGLTVSEAMWKGRAVVASRVGGIQDQITDGETGVLVDPVDLAGFAEAVLGLLRDPAAAESLGERARDRVRDSFLGPRSLGQWVDLLESLVTAPVR